MCVCVQGGWTPFHRAELLRHATLWERSTQLVSWILDKAEEACRKSTDKVRRRIGLQQISADRKLLSEGGVVAVGVSTSSVTEQQISAGSSFQVFISFNVASKSPSSYSPNKFLYGRSILFNDAAVPVNVIV